MFPVPTGLGTLLLDFFLRELDRWCCDDKVEDDDIGWCSLLQKAAVDFLGRVLANDGAAVTVGRKETVELEIIDARPLLPTLPLHPCCRPVAEVSVAGHWSEGKSANSGGGNWVTDALNGELSDMTDDEVGALLAAAAAEFLFQIVRVDLVKRIG